MRATIYAAVSLLAFVAVVAICGGIEQGADPVNALYAVLWLIVSGAAGLKAAGEQ